MSSELAKDMTVGQVVDQGKVALGQAAQKIPEAEGELIQICNVIIDAFPNTEASKKASDIRDGLVSGSKEAITTVTSVQSLLKEFNIPLSLFSGMQLKGSGQLALVLHQLTTSMEGLQSSMTKSNKVINLWVGYLSVASAVLGAVLAVLPSSVQNYSLGGGFTVGVVILGIGRIAAVLTSRYGDAAPRAELVKS